jgi:hypothetical protein
MAKDEFWRVRQAEDHGHENNPGHFGAKPRAEARLKQRPKKEFLDESGFIGEKVTFLPVRYARE